MTIKAEEALLSAIVEGDIEAIDECSTESWMTLSASDKDFCKSLAKGRRLKDSLLATKGVALLELAVTYKNKDLVLKLIKYRTLLSEYTRFRRSEYHNPLYHSHLIDQMANALSENDVESMDILLHIYHKTHKPISRIFKKDPLVQWPHRFIDAMKKMHQLNNMACAKLFLKASIPQGTRKRLIWEGLTSLCNQNVKLFYEFLKAAVVRKEFIQHPEKFFHFGQFDRDKASKVMSLLSKKEVMQFLLNMITTGAHRIFKMYIDDYIFLHLGDKDILTLLKAIKRHRYYDLEEMVQKAWREKRPEKMYQSMKPLACQKYIAELDVDIHQQHFDDIEARLMSKASAPSLAALLQVDETVEKEPVSQSNLPQYEPVSVIALPVETDKNLHHQNEAAQLLGSSRGEQGKVFVDTITGTQQKAYQEQNQMLFFQASKDNKTKASETDNKERNQQASKKIKKIQRRKAKKVKKASPMLVLS